MLQSLSDYRIHNKVKNKKKVSRCGVREEVLCPPAHAYSDLGSLFLHIMNYSLSAQIRYPQCSRNYKPFTNQQQVLQTPNYLLVGWRDIYKNVI